MASVGLSDMLCSSSASLDCEEDGIEAFECADASRGSPGCGRGSSRGTMLIGGCSNHNDGDMAGATGSNGGSGRVWEQTGRGSVCSSRDASIEGRQRAPCIGGVTGTSACMPCAPPALLAVLLHLGAYNFTTPRIVFSAQLVHASGPGGVCAELQRPPFIRPAHSFSLFGRAKLSAEGISGQGTTSSSRIPSSINTTFTNTPPPAPALYHRPRPRTIAIRRGRRQSPSRCTCARARPRKTPQVDMP